MWSNSTERIKVKLLSLGRLNVILILLVISMMMAIIALSMNVAHRDTAFQSSHQHNEQYHRSKRSADVRRSPPAPGSRQDTYVRWGRTTCPESAVLVYEGIVGGESHSHAGGGSNYLCLPRDPIYEQVNPAASAVGGYMYGAEYEISPVTSTFPFASTDGKKLHDHNVPCAVCLTAGPVVMIPARNQCYPGWKLEFKGYLMTEHHKHPSNKNFVCMDNDPEADDAGYRNENGALFYQVEGKCGSLPCPAYRDHAELTCAVCSLDNQGDY